MDEMDKPTTKFTLCSSYFHAPGAKWAGWFFHVWWATLLRHAKPLPESVIIITQANCKVPQLKWDWGHRKFKPQMVNLSGSLGHCDHVLKGEKKVFMPACCAGWLAGAWLAYMNETDLIVLEQDALVFGPWVERLYKNIGTRSVLMGCNQSQGAATSLFLVRHGFIPQFVADYLAGGPENHPNRICEAKMHRLTGQKPEDYGQYFFRCGKDRPVSATDWQIMLDEPVWWIEKTTPDELKMIAQRGGLIAGVKGMPQQVERFSNHA